MSIRILSRIIKNGKNLLFNYKRVSFHHFKSVQTHSQPKSLQKAAILDLKIQNNFVRFSRRLLIDNVLSRVTSPQSVTLRAEATKKFAFGDSLPFLSLVGCSLASGNGVLTKEDELEGICWEIREAVAKYQNQLEDKIIEKRADVDVQLDDLNIGPYIQKGCNAVVYAVNFKKEFKDLPDFRSTDQIDVTYNEEPKQPLPFGSLPRFVQNFGGSVDNIQFHSQPGTSRDTGVRKVNKESVAKTVKFNENIEVRETTLPSSSESSSSQASTGMENLTQIAESSILQYPWALKMMFNYDIQSNAMSILKAMYKETIPARSRANSNIENWEKAMMEQTILLPAHPNIVHMPTFFCDQIPNLQHGNDLYPSALPARLNPTSGYGRNMSLFLLMKRYNGNLREYLDENDLDMRTRVILFAQLLEAVTHINSHGIAHRDLKSDNILVDSISDSLPILVLSDFGCCLADKKIGLRLPYTSYEIDKGGNVNLMAPEIVTKTPSMFAILNYTKADLWACGTIAYEIFGYANPFYESEYSKTLRNVDYDDAMLPELHDEIPLIVRKLIENMLQRNPANRLSCDLSANVLELYLWAPSSWIKYGRNPTNNEMLEWLLSLTTKVLCERGLGAINADYMMKSRRTFTEYVLITTFLSRANLKSIRKALNWIHNL